LSGFERSHQKRSPSGPFFPPAPYMEAGIQKGCCDEVPIFGETIPCGRSIRVYGVDLLPERLALARKLGADDAFLVPADEQGLRQLLVPYTEGRGADVVIITAAGTRPFLQAIAGVCKGGTIHIFAAHSAIVPTNLEHIYQQEIGIISTYSSSPEELHIALDLLNSRAVRVDGLISHYLPLERFAEGVTLMRQHAALKVYFQIAGEF
jgi:L-iditol 2-dehydrogenase